MPYNDLLDAATDFHTITNLHPGADHYTHSDGFALAYTDGHRYLYRHGRTNSYDYRYRYGYGYGYGYRYRNRDAHANRRTRSRAN
jgi:hypothetical protein